FATGLSLYVLSGHKAERVEQAVRRARAFLSKTQRPDGSWPMASRAAEPSGPGPASDLRPIRYFGTAWATIGLLRSSPRNAESNRSRAEGDKRPEDGRPAAQRAAKERTEGRADRGCFRFPEEAFLLPIPGQKVACVIDTGTGNFVELHGRCYG